MTNCNTSGYYLNLHAPSQLWGLIDFFKYVFYKFLGVPCLGLGLGLQPAGTDFRSGGLTFNTVISTWGVKITVGLKVLQMYVCV